MDAQLNAGSAGEYYILSERWSSDLDFFENELGFFEKLIGKNIIFAPDNKYIPRLQQEHLRLRKLISDRLLLKDAVTDQMKKLGQLIKNNQPAGTDLQAGHEKLKDVIAAFVTKYREFKSGLYHEAEMLTGHIEPEKLLSL